MTTTAAIETHQRRPVRSAEDRLSESVETRRTMQTFVSHIAWESEVWIAEDPDQHDPIQRRSAPWALF